MKFIPTRFAIVAFSLILISGCRDNPQRHLKLGQWYAQKGLVEEAILEFHEVARLYPENPTSLSRKDYQVLSRAHYNLSLMYSKKGWWDYALQEAEISFQMQPTKDYFDLLTLIKNRATLEESESGS
ncbi:MAG: tetratricopeptide repeat protein [Fidelibacterota bacterium]